MATKHYFTIRLRDHAPLDYENIGSAIVYRCVHYAWPCMSVLTIVTKIGRRAATTEIVYVYVRCTRRKEERIILFAFLLFNWARYLVALLARGRFNDRPRNSSAQLHSFQPGLYYLKLSRINHPNMMYRMNRFI